MISIIIPVRNEEDTIKDLILYLQEYAPYEEIIIVDGKSSDNTVKIATELGARVISSAPGRAIQMNKGASLAKGNILYFLHADTIPPKNFIRYIEESVDHGFKFGFFKIQIEPSHFWIRAFEWIGNVKTKYLVFGDRSLFVSRELFALVKGFKEDHVLMEDQNIIIRMSKHAKYVYLPQIIKASSRKYFENGVFRLQFIYTILYFMYYFGFTQDLLMRTYKKLIRSKQYD